MERLQSIFQRHNAIPMDKFFDFTPLAQPQKRYLTQVYGLLAGTVLSTALGVGFSRHFLSLPLFVTALGQLGCTLYLSSTAQRRYTTFKERDCLIRIGTLGILSFLTGCSLSLIVDYAHYINPSILPTAFLATLGAFVCFSLAAMFATERKFLFLGSLLSSLLFYLSMVSLFNMFFGSTFAHDIVVYGGLLVYLGFILYDTQAILYEHKMGVHDPVIHALTFYGNVIGIFVRLLYILIQREQRSRDERQEKQRR